MLTDGTVDVGGGRVGNQLNRKVGKLANGVTFTIITVSSLYAAKDATIASHTQLGIRNGQRHLLLILDLVKQAGKTRRNFSFNERSNFLQSSSGAVEFLEALQLKPIALLAR